MGTLIGRERELARLDAALASGMAMFVRGPRGCGVSALLDAAVADGPGVLRAAGVAGESGFPYAALHQLLRPLRRAVRELDGEPGEALRASFGFSDEGVPDAASVAAALVSLARDAGPGIVCVDDWQWVDAESRAALEAFIASGVGVPVLLGGHGPGPSGVVELAVGPLDPVASSALLGDGLPLLVRERVLRESAGRPLALKELPLAYAGASDGVLLGSWAPLTGVLEEAFADGLEALAPDCAVAVLVAALDDGGRLEDVLSAAALLVGREMSGVDLAPAVACGLIELEGDRLTFAHPLTRAAVRHASSPAARAAGHRAFASVVAARDPDRATWHRVVGAPGTDGALAAELEAVALRSRAGGDYERAAAGLRRAANLTPAGPERSRRLVAAAELAAEIGGIEVADRLVEAAVPAHLDAVGRARLLALRSRASTSSLVATARACPDPDLAARLWWRAATEIQAAGGDGAALAREAEALGATVMRGVEAGGGAAISRGGEARGGTGTVRGGAAISRGGEARAPTVAVGADGRPADAPLECSISRPSAGKSSTRVADPVALSLRGYLAFVSGDAHGAVALLDRAVHELRGQRRRTRLGQVLALAAHARLSVSDLEQASADGEEAAALCGQVRQPLWGALARAALARVAALRGDEASAERHAAAAERVALRVRGASVLAIVQQARGELALGAGRPAEAFAYLRRPFDPTDPAHDLDSALTTLDALAEAATTDDERAFVRDRLAEPVTIARDAARRFAAPGHDAAPRFAATPRDAASRLAAGPRPSSATDVVEARVAISSPARSALARAHAKLVLADDADADAAFARAAAVIGADTPFAHARMLLVHGMRLRRHRRPADSREPLRAAASTFEALGAAPWAEKAQRELAATAETAHRSDDDLDRLTPRELEIARLAARGMTNPAIAADLALSPRTVGHHLAKIFPKLEIASRANLGAALERRGY